MAQLGGPSSRRRGGGFTGEGDWLPIKLFLQRPGIEAEVFLNFNLADKVGEFAEKDSDYADDLLRFMARELRDGPLPLQTPENDRRVSARGPKLEAFRDIGPVGAAFQSFEAQGQRLVYSVPEGDGRRVFSVALEGEPQPRELFHLEHDLSGFVCDASEALCLVEQVTHRQKNTYAGDDPTQLFSFRRAPHEWKPLSGPWGDKSSLGTSAVSPDRKWLAVLGMLPKSSKPGALRVVHFVKAEQPSTIRTVQVGEEWLDVIGWRGTGSELRAIVASNFGLVDDEKPKYWLASPETGVTSPLTTPPPEAEPETLSPDGKHRFACDGDKEIVITEVATGSVKRFAVAPRERHALTEGCGLSWRGNRYLEFSPERTAFIDIETLKLSFLFDGAEEPDSLDYDATFRWAVESDDAQLRIARVTVR